MAAILRELGAVACAIESVKGTAETPTTAQAAIEVEDVDYEVMTEHYERNPIHPAFDRPVSVPGPTHAEFSFRVPFAGALSAGAVPMYGNVLRCAGLSETIIGGTSVTYRPISDHADQETGTFDLYRNGKRVRVAGACVDLSKAVNHGDKPMIAVTGKGLFVHEQDAAIPSSVPYLEVAPPAALNATLTWKSFSLIATQVMFKLGNVVELRPSMGSATGYAHAIISDRDPEITIDPEDELVASLDFITHLRSNVSGVAQLLVSWGSVAGNQIEIDARQCQLVAAPYGDRAGLTIRNITLKPRRRTEAGDNFFSLTYL